MVVSYLLLRFLQFASCLSSPLRFCFRLLLFLLRSVVDWRRFRKIMQVDDFLCGPHSEQMVEAGGYWEKLENSAAGCRVEVKGGLKIAGFVDYGSWRMEKAESCYGVFWLNGC